MAMHRELGTPRRSVSAAAAYSCSGPVAVAARQADVAKPDARQRLRVPLYVGGRHRQPRLELASGLLMFTP